MNDMHTQNVMAGIAGAYVIFALFFAIIIFVSWWKVFEKAGHEGWKAIIPIYNLYILCQISWGNGVYFLAFFVPFVNGIFGLITMYKLGQAFGKGSVFILGMMFVPIIFFPMLAFGQDRYLGVVN